MHKKSKYVLFALAAISILVFLANAFFVWSWGDDFLIKNVLQTMSVADFLSYDYMHFDGRSLSIGYFISRYCLSAEFPWLATLIASMLYIASAFLLFQMSGLKRHGFIITSLFTAMLWLAGFHSHSETLYWQTGMLYVVEVFMILLAYFVYQKSLKSRIPAILVFVLFALSGIASPGAVIAFITVFVIQLFMNKKLGRQNAAMRNIAPIAGLTTGLILVVASPGSSARFLDEGGFDSEAFSLVYTFYFRIHKFVETFFNLNTPMIWLVLFAGVFLTHRILQQKTRENYMQVIYEYRWLIASAISLLFYLPRMKYYISSPRLNIHFVFFIFVFFSVQTKRFSGLLQANTDFTWLKYANFIFVIFILFASSQLWGSIHALRKVHQREALYKQHKGESLILRSDDLVGPPSTRMFTDVQEDSLHHFNTGIARYFGLRSVSKLPYH